MTEKGNEEILDLNQQALVLGNNGRLQDAMEYFAKAAELDPMYLETYINMGNIYAGAEQYDKALESYQKVLLADKHYAEVYFHLGNMYFIQDHFEEAIKHYNLSISEGYQDGRLYFNLGLVYEEKGEVEYALRNYSKAIFKESDVPEFRLKKATLQMGNSMFEEALETLTEMTKYTPDIFEGYHYKFETLCALKRYEDAEKTLQAAGELFPADVSIFYDKIRLQSRLGNLERAMQMIEEAEKMEGHEEEARNLSFEKAKLFGMGEKIQEAIECFEHCLSFETEGNVDYETRYYLMNIFLSQKKYDKLKENAEKVLELPNDNPYVRAAFYYRALAVMNLSGVKEAEKLFREAISLYRMVTIQTPTVIDAYLFRALCHKELKENDKALDLVEFVEKLTPNSSEIHVIKGNILDVMGKKEEAEEERNKAKELKPELEIVF